MKLTTLQIVSKPFRMLTLRIILFYKIWQSFINFNVDKF